jgi:hypothetical protein
MLCEPIPCRAKISKHTSFCQITQNFSQHFYKILFSHGDVDILILFSTDYLKVWRFTSAYNNITTNPVCLFVSVTNNSNTLLNVVGVPLFVRHYNRMQCSPARKTNKPFPHLKKTFMCCIKPGPTSITHVFLQTCPQHCVHHVQAILQKTGLLDRCCFTASKISSRLLLT